MRENAKNSRPTWDESYIHSRGTTQISAALIEILKAQQLRVPPIKDGRAVNASFALFPYLTIQARKQILPDHLLMLIHTGFQHLARLSVMDSSSYLSVHRIYKYAYMTKYNQFNASLSRSSCSAFLIIAAGNRRNGIISTWVERMAACNSLGS
jgi:hypothetical protein